MFSCPSCISWTLPSYPCSASRAFVFLKACSWTSKAHLAAEVVVSHPLRALRQVEVAEHPVAGGDAFGVIVVLGFGEHLAGLVASCQVDTYKNNHTRRCGYFYTVATVQMSVRSGAPPSGAARAEVAAQPLAAPPLCGCRAAPCGRFRRGREISEGRRWLPAAGVQKERHALQRVFLFGGDTRI